MQRFFFILIFSFWTLLGTKNAYALKYFNPFHLTPFQMQTLEKSSPTLKKVMAPNFFDRLWHGHFGFTKRGRARIHQLKVDKLNQYLFDAQVSKRYADQALKITCELAKAPESITPIRSIKDLLYQSPLKEKYSRNNFSLGRKLQYQLSLVAKTAFTALNEFQCLGFRPFHSILKRVGCNFYHSNEVFNNGSGGRIILGRLPLQSEVAEIANNLHQNQKTNASFPKEAPGVLSIVEPQLEIFYGYPNKALPHDFLNHHLHQKILPSPDYQEMNPHTLYRGALFIASKVDKNLPIYVHCKAGESRSFTTILAYFLLKDLENKKLTLGNITREKINERINLAYKMIHPKRPQAHLQVNKRESLHKFVQYYLSEITNIQR